MIFENSFSEDAGHILAALYTELLSILNCIAAPEEQKCALEVELK